MAWIFPIKSISEANQSGGKSTILRPVYGIALLCLVATVVSFAFHLPEWIGFVFATLTFLLILVAIYMILFCLHTDKDALRSEWYSINKKAIEHGLLGDDKTGTVTETTVTVVAKPNDNSKKLGGGDE